MPTDWQSIAAILIAVCAGVWAAKKTLGPIVTEFRKKKTDTKDAGCGGCGDSKTGCGSDKT